MYKLTNRAVDDLSQIWEHTYNYWSESQADKYYDMLLDSCEEIGNCPELGRVYSGVIKNLLGYKVGRHIIFYCRNNEYEVEIIRILHEQMDLKNRINE
jgi:toxin ParE1/3/4